MIKTKESPIFYTKNSQSIIILIFLFKIQRGQKGVLGSGHMRNNSFLRKIFLIHRKLLQHLLHQGLLVIAVIDGEVFFVA